MPVDDTKDLSIVPRGRERTDKSLSAERAKTDESLLTGRKQTERRADQTVSADRAHADEARSQSRQDADGSREKAGVLAGGAGLEERRKGDKRLLHERQTADEALEAERARMDATMDLERRQKKAAEEKLFQTERGETDRDLTQERNQTDVEAKRERDAHVVTRAALTTRDEFLAIVSHDLRNPLGSVQMATDLLAGKVSAGADEDTREYLGLIERNISEALRLIDDLLDMERVAVGKLGLHIARHDVSTIIRHAEKTLQSRASSRKITIQNDAQGLEFPVDCDRDRVSQVLSNLIGNAVKFTQEGGTVTLAAEKSGPGEVTISVADAGPGIPEDMHKRIFERFSQIGKADRRGLGLGLYISNMIVEAHGGRIWVESKVGKGSVFRFTLPAVGFFKD